MIPIRANIVGPFWFTTTSRASVNPPGLLRCFAFDNDWM